jgi:hypothetical protein
MCTYFIYWRIINEHNKKISISLIALTIIGLNIKLVNVSAADNLSTKSGVIDINSNSKNVKVSEVLTYDELIDQISKNEKISKEHPLSNQQTMKSLKQENIKMILAE